MRYNIRAILVVFLLMLFSGVTLAAAGLEAVTTFQGRVLEVSSAGPQPFLEDSWESQLVTVRLLSGPHKNSTISVINTLTGHPFFDLKVQKGDKILLEGDFSGLETEYFITDFSRKLPLAFITLLFTLLVILIGGRQGIKAIVSLIGMGLIIFYMILPLVLRGYNPIVVTVGLSSLITILFVVYVCGYSIKTVAAICGVVGGLFVAGLLAYGVGKASYLSGLSSGEAQTLQFMESGIDFQGLLFSGIILGALGAIFDVGISIASSMEQIKEADPETDFQTLFKRGISIGRDVIATMSNTLILAYVGSSLPLLLLFQASESNWSEVFNLDLVASEVIRAMSGSIGLTLAIPITAFVAAILFVKPQDKSHNLSD